MGFLEVQNVINVCERIEALLQFSLETWVVAAGAVGVVISLVGCEGAFPDSGRFRQNDIKGTNGTTALLSLKKRPAQLLHEYITVVAG